MTPRALPALLLGLLASAEALALQHTEEEESLALPARQWKFWKNPGREKRALLILHGLLRGVDHFWPLLQRNFVGPNTEAGYHFTIVLHTSLSVNCSEKNTQLGRADWCNTMMLHYGTRPEERRERLMKIFAPHDLVLVDTEDPCYTKPGNRDHATTEYLQGDWRNAGCSGTLHFASRGAQALDSFRGEKGFHRVAIIRTDNCFELPGRKHEDLPVLLDDVCKSHLGAGIIGNLNRVPTPYGHDYDHAWLLCDGSRAQVFRDAVAAFGLNCRSPCRGALQCPKGFCTGKMQCTNNVCESAATFARGGMAFGTLDNYLVANYQPTRYADGVIRLNFEPGDLDEEGNVLF